MKDEFDNPENSRMTLAPTLWDRFVAWINRPCREELADVKARIADLSARIAAAKAKL